MEEQTDKTFIKNFSLVVVALVLFTITIAFLANIVGFTDHEDAPNRKALTDERIKPVAGAYTGDAATAAMEEAATASATETAVAFDGSLDAEMIYNNVCAACHAAAILGAPKPGSPELAARAEKGMDLVMQNALNGLNAMPPKGGRPDLSDEQIRVAIEFMLK